MSIEKRYVTFKSGETFAAARLFLPETAAPSARVPRPLRSGWRKSASKPSLPDTVFSEPIPQDG
jgi:hypothetical protein